MDNGCGMNHCGVANIVVCNRHMAKAVFEDLQDYLTHDTFKAVQEDLYFSPYPEFALIDLIAGWDDAKSMKSTTPPPPPESPARAVFKVTVDLDGVPGSFFNTDSWTEYLKRDTTLPPWYNPAVELMFDPRPKRNPR